MIRLHFIVEGQTEETFVRDILAFELAAKSIAVDVHRITTGRRKGISYRGGFVSYQHLRRDLSLWMKQERRSGSSRFTTMIDLYRLPKDFPGTDASKGILDPFKKIELLESALKYDLGDNRLIPYIQLHEFEALLFSSPTAFSSAFPNSESAIDKLKGIRNAVPSPEHINEGATTAPSKRICDIFPTYVKTTYGLTIAKTIGLGKMRSECGHFDSWIQTLLELGDEN